MNMKYILILLLLLSLAGNIFLLSSSGGLDKSVFCSKFNEQASKRIRTYYTNGDEINVYPNEIFYSPVIKSCIAVWDNIRFSLTGSESRHYAIFDAVTNKHYFGTTIVTDTQDEQLREFNTNQMAAYQRELSRLRGND
jgi:hypothetical protein